MQTNGQGVPEGYHSITPYLAPPSADRLIDFLTAAFDATVVSRSHRPDGSVAHAEVQIGDSKLMMCDATAECPTVASTLYLYVADADEVYRRAISAGARSLMEPTDMPYGDRNGGVVDPAGHQWWIATRLPSTSETSS
jgi:PhnB protein